MSGATNAGERNTSKYHPYNSCKQEMRRRRRRRR